MAKEYYDKLFKNFCLGDLSRYNEGMVGLMWRTKKQVIEGKGQFSCGNIHCDTRDSLSSYELPFNYRENNERKRALVKIRVCPPCSEKLNYKANQKKRKCDDDERESNKRHKSEPEESSSSHDTTSSDNCAQTMCS
eukprot:TRINITY_DN1236_c0_g1_i2.p1 TRINITY_DN1236_c0_g1~~TRINITY_DN1236_c0_g1_i2.p1  ORF type:complete len:136 (+),score=21.86 TRINITY_DN1236_c0_g1_i2:766-1173(+)